MTPATKAKAIASGTNARATVKPDKISILNNEKDGPSSGVTALYDGLNIPCLPVAINCGYFWSRRRFLRYPGKMVIEFLKPIEPGLEKEVFTKKLYDVIEDKSDALLSEAEINFPK